MPCEKYREALEKNIRFGIHRDTLNLPMPAIVEMPQLAEGQEAIDFDDFFASDEAEEMLVVLKREGAEAEAAPF